MLMLLINQFREIFLRFRKIAANNSVGSVLVIFLALPSLSHAEVSLTAGSSWVTGRYSLISDPTAGDNSRKRIIFTMTGYESFNPWIGYTISVSPDYNDIGTHGADVYAYLYDYFNFSPSFYFTAPPGVTIKITESAVAWNPPGTFAAPNVASASKSIYYRSDYGFWGETEQGEAGVTRAQPMNLVQDPVDVATGEFHQDQVDLHVNGPLPIEMRRVYSSRNTANNGFGVGWLPNYLSFLIPAADLSTIQAADSGGSVVTFRRAGTSDLWSPTSADNPELTNNSGGAGNLLNSTITRTIAGGGTISYQWHLPDGSQRNFTVRQFPMLDLVRERPYLDKWTDNRGNELTFAYGTSSAANDYGKVKLIQSSNGTSVSLVYNTGGLVRQAAASDGRTVNYTYDTNASDLIGVQMPDGQQFSYTYGANVSGVSNHLIVKETKPNGRILQNVYDTSGRVVQQKATVGLNLTPVVNATFDYSVPGQTTVRDAFNNATVYHYTGNMVTQIVDPLGQTITKTWYPATDPATGAYQGNLQSVTDQRGLQTTYRYDAQGNVIQTKITGDLRGDGVTTHTASTTAVYDTLNRPTSVTDASDITTVFSYGDASYLYLPTQIITSKAGTTLRTDKLEYTAQFDATNIALFSVGLLSRKTVAFGSADQAVTEYTFNTAGFVILQEAYTGTSDPSVVTTFDYNAHGELITTTDGDSRSTNYTYDGMSRPLTKVVKDENGTVLGTWTTTYTGNGEVASTTGPRTSPANLATNTYDGAGRLQSTVVAQSQANADGSGVAATGSATTSYVHDFFGNLTSMTDPNGNVTTFTYDAIGQLLTKGTAGLRTESFQYEPGGSVSQSTNPLGGVTRKFYTATGKLRRQENPDGSVLEWRYYDDGRVQKEILRNGSFWETVYDDIAHRVTRTLKRSGGTTLATDVSEFDLRGNLIHHTDAEGFLKTATYDGLNRVKTATGPVAGDSSEQQVTTTIYGASAKTLLVQNGLNEVAVTTSDALGRPLLTTVSAAGGATVRTTSYAYSADHHAVTVTEGSGAGAISRTVYTDTADRTVLIVQGDGKFTRTTYDLNGNLLTSADALGQTTSYAYNALDQAVTQTLPDGTVTTFTYNAAGGQLTRGMAGGALTHEQTYDTAGRKVTERLYSGATNTRQFSYVYYPSGNPFAGLLQTVTGPRDTVTTTYDDFLRPSAVVTLSLSNGLPETNSTTTYTYDRRGLATLISQNPVSAGPATAVSRAYDGYGQLLTESVTVGGQAHSSVTQTWDAAGRRASLNEAGSTLSAPLFAYQYQADGAMTRVTAPGTFDVGLSTLDYSFAYADNGLLASRTNPFRTLAVNSRDAVGRVLQQTTLVGGNAAMVETMTWRANSTLNSYVVNRTGTGAWNESRAYSYNSRGQLLSEGFSPAAGLSSALNYAFDGSTTRLGIRTDAKIGSGAPVSWESSATTINALGRVALDQITGAPRIVPASGVSLGADHVDLLVDGVAQGKATHPGFADPVGAWSASLNLLPGSHTLTANAVHPSGQYTATASSTFTVAGDGSGGNITSGYDDDGNVTSRTWSTGRVQTLTWDAFGRLITVADRDTANNGSDWSAVYDGLGRRLKVTQQTVTAGVASGTATVTTSIYDPQIEFLEIGVAVNGARAWKVYGPDLNGRYGSLQGTGGLEATIVDVGGATKGVLNDQFGNGVGSVSGGSVAWFTTRVSAYGPLPGSPAETLTDITRVAEATTWRSRRVDASGFIYLGARYYEATSGRFLSADPAGHAASMSLYDFCNGDPVNFFDPDGRCKNKESEEPGYFSRFWSIIKSEVLDTVNQLLWGVEDSAHRQRHGLNDNEDDSDLARLQRIMNLPDEIADHPIRNTVMLAPFAFFPEEGEGNLELSNSAGNELPSAPDAQAGRVAWSGTVR